MRSSLKQSQGLMVKIKRSCNKRVDAFRDSHAIPNPDLEVIVLTVCLFVFSFNFALFPTLKSALAMLLNRHFKLHHQTKKVFIT